jgi:hypothetical protein
VGVVEASKLFMDVHLSHFRGLFLEIQTLGENSFPKLLKTVPELRESYKLFLTIQSKNVIVLVHSNYLIQN